MLRLIRNVLLGIVIYIYFIPYTHTNEVLIPYTTKVMNIVNTYCNKNQYSSALHKYVYFHKLDKDEVGECTFGYNKFVIKIDNSFLQRANEDEKYEVIFHEMYHCLFFKDHVTDPNNYMFYRIAHLNKETIVKQFTDDVKKICEAKSASI